VGLTVGADNDLPAVARKPSELGGRLAAGNRAWHLAEAADLESDTGGIEKRMLVTSVHRPCLPPSGHLGTADPAKDGLVILFLERRGGSGLRRAGDL